MTMSRKRRRSQAVSAEELHDENHAADVETDGEERRKEQEIWDAFKEEHHEGTPIMNASTCDLLN